MKKIFIVIIVLVIAGGLFGYSQYQKQVKVNRISSFEECADAGFPVMESYPPRCQTSDGRLFTQDIGNELEYSDEIVVENPRPNQKITSPFTITGKARGIWYFEANFSAELFDTNNRSLGVAIVHAQGEWMTEEFLPFRGELMFDTPSTEKGILLIKSANPSGLPENEKELVIPVVFE